MKIKVFLLVIAAAAIQSCGAAILKTATVGKSFLLIALAMAVFGCGFSLYYHGLQKLKLFIAQPLFSSAMFLSTTLISILYFKDAVSVHQIAGIVAILGGMVIMCQENREPVPMGGGEKGASIPDVKME